ncbi:MAG: OpgC family protein, partial [Beijerinckiaceae bacterium]
MPLRSANAVDFWRGVALVSIFANHIPGFYYERFTHRNFGISDSAELFVFLAGWSARSLAGQRDTLSMQNMILRVGARGVQLYAAQILITMVAIALIAMAAMGWDNPLLLEWHNAAAVFQDPVSTHVGLVTLQHHLGFFDILPLYVVLMFGAVGLAVLHRAAPVLILPLSVLIYLAAHVWRLNVPTWPVEGEWLFNPFCWQLIFVLGFVCAGDSALAYGRQNLRWLR